MSLPKERKRYSRPHNVYGYREGVEKLPDTKKYNLSSSKQDDLILFVVKHFPQSKKFLEYEDYYAMPTRENANEFLDAVAERYADRADELKGLVSYISNRPYRVLGSGSGNMSSKRRTGSSRAVTQVK